MCECACIAVKESFSEEIVGSVLTEKLGLAKDYGKFLINGELNLH